MERLETLIDEAISRGYVRLSLETGVQDAFEPARRLYLRYGFRECGPFADTCTATRNCCLTFTRQPSSSRAS